MARDHARLQTRIWTDCDFRSLTRDAQHMYFTLTTQPALSYCGVMDWWPGRLAQLAKDADEATVFDAVKHLIDTRYIELDPETSELLVRSYVRHDGVLDRINMGKACGRALEKVVSLDLRDTVIRELARLYKEKPYLPGFKGIEELYSTEYQTVTSMALGM